MTGKELAVRRWVMKVGKTADERAVLFGLAYECNGQGKLAEIRAGARAWTKGEAGEANGPIVRVRPALRSLQQAGQVQFISNSQWRAV